LYQNCNAIGALLSEFYGPETDADKLAVTFLYIKIYGDDGDSNVDHNSGDNLQDLRALTPWP
jgi:hypothetical protein